MLIASAPTDPEMARLRKLQDSYAEDLGPLGYACSTAWLAALFARTELCIRARTRLIGRLLAMGRARLQALQAACRPLAESTLPELIALFAAKKAGCVDKLRSDVGMQEMSGGEAFMLPHTHPHGII